jgi:hypothetical protein
MPGFEVQTDTLTSVAARVGDVADRLTAASGRVSRMDAAATGHEGLADALSHFADEWDYSLGKIREHAEGVRDMLGRSAEAYVTTDSGIADAAGG